MNMRVDETGQDQPSLMVIDRYLGSDPAQQRPRLADRNDPALGHDNDAVLDMAVTVVGAGQTWVGMETQNTAAQHALGAVGGSWGQDKRSFKRLAAIHSIWRRTGFHLLLQHADRARAGDGSRSLAWEKALYSIHL